jgi:hypothetical protein
MAPKLGGYRRSRKRLAPLRFGINSAEHVELWRTRPTVGDFEDWVRLGLRRRTERRPRGDNFPQGDMR